MHSILAWNVQNYDAPPLLVGRGFLPLAIAASRLQTLAIFPTHMFTIMRKKPRVYPLGAYSASNFLHLQYVPLLEIP